MHTSAKYAARHLFKHFRSLRARQGHQKLESIFSTLCAALNLAVIGTIMGHANVVMDCHLISKLRVAVASKLIAI